MQRSIACALAATTLALHSSAQTLVRAINGPSANAQYGKACLVVPDQNADGFKDLLVGAPGFNSQRGAIYCVSGAYLAFGTGTQTLWSVAPSANPGDLFGYALADVGDVTNDGVRDFLVGQPGYDISTSNDIGAVRLVNGASHAVVSLISGFATGCLFGSAVAACADSNGDGKAEIMIGAPGSSSSEGRVYVIGGGALTFSLPINSFPGDFESYAFEEFGASIASGFDIDGDGFQELVVGAPNSSGGAAGAGAVRVFEVTPVISGPGSPMALGLRANLESVIAGERMGSSVDGGQDYDGDGVPDIVVGAPRSPSGTIYQLGRAVVLSGARLIAQTPPYEIYTFTTTPGFAGSSHFHFGAAVRATSDLNGDGVAEILVGAPDYFSNQFTGPGRGFASIYSGATGTKLASVYGASNERLGDALGGALADLDGDGFKEFTVAGSSSDTGGTDSGVVKCYRLFPVQPATYCTSKLNSLGCTPSIAFSGSPSANPTAPFLITASNFVNQKNGLLFYSHAPDSASFQGGFKCVANPTMRTPPMNSGGSTSGSSCTGTYSFDFNNWIATGWDSSLAAGGEIYAQYWSRDPQSASHTSLSNGARFLINP